MPRILAAANGWVTVANFGREHLDTYGWKLSDLQAHSNLTCDALSPGECVRILFDSQGIVQLLDSNNVVIDKIDGGNTKFPVVYALDDRLEVDTALFEEIPNAGVGILCITGQSTATLANLSDSIVDLRGWELADTPLEGILKPGETSRFSTSSKPLNNNTFLLQLVNADQNIVDSVLYQYVETSSPVVFDLDHRISARDHHFNTQNPILANKAALLDPVEEQEDDDEDDWEDANDEDETIQGSTAADIASEEFQSRTFSVSTKDELDETLGVDAVIEDDDDTSSASPRMAPVGPPRTGTAKTGSLSYSNADMNKQERGLPVTASTKSAEEDGTPTLPVSAVSGGDASSWIKSAKPVETVTSKSTTEYKPVESYSDSWTKASEQTPEDSGVTSRSIVPSAAPTSDAAELTEEKAASEEPSRGHDSTAAATAGLAAVGAAGAAGIVASGSFGETTKIDEEEEVDGQEIVDDGFEDYSSDEEEEYQPADGGSYDRSIIYSPAGVPIGTTLPPIPEENEVLGEEGEDESSMLPVEITAPPDAIEAIETVVEEEPVSRNSVLAKVKQWNQSDDDKEAVEAYVMSREYEGAESPAASPGAAARGGGTGGTGAVVNELTSKWNTAVVEEGETREVAKPAEGGSTEVVGGLTSKWNNAVSEETQSRSASLAPEAGSTKVVDGLTSKWNNALIEEVQTRSVTKSTEVGSTEVVGGLTSKWNDAVKEESNPSPAVAASREVNVKDVVESSDSVKDMTSKWMDTKAEEEVRAEKPKTDEETAAPGAVRSLSAKWAIGKVGEREDQSRTIIMDDDDYDTNGKVSEMKDKWNAPVEEARSIQPKSPVNPVTVDALQSMWSSPKAEGTAARSVEPASPVNPGTVDALSSMWSSPKAEATAPRSADPTSPVNPGTVDALSSMWSSPKAETPADRSVAAPSPISPGSVNEITTKWKDIATETNVVPAVAVGATAGTVAAMTGKWATGKKESEEKPLARSISQEKKGDVGKLQAKWAEVETAAPVGTATAPKAKRASKGFRPKPKDVDTEFAEVSDPNEVNGSKSIAITSEPVENKAEIGNGKTGSRPAPVAPVIQKKEADEYDDDDDDEFEDTFDEPIGAFPVGHPVSNPKSLDLDAELGNTNETNTTKSTFRESPTSRSSKKVGGDSTTERSVLAGVGQEKTKAEIPEGSGFVFEDNVIPLVKEKNSDYLPKVRDASLEGDNVCDGEKEETLVIEDNVISEWNAGSAKKDAEAMPTVASFAEDGSDIVSEWKDTGESSKVISEWKAENEEGELENSSSVIVHEDIDIGLADAVGMRGNSWMINESAADLDPSSMVEKRGMAGQPSAADLEIMEAIEVDEEVAIDADYVRSRGSLELRRSLEKLPERELVQDRRRKFALFNKRKKDDKGSFTAPLAINATDSMKIENAPRQHSSFVEPHIMDIGQVTPVGSMNTLLPSVSSKKSSTFSKLSKLTGASSSAKTPVGTGPEAFTASGVGILCAMINPVGDDAENEWVVIANFAKKAVDLDGWALSDTKRKALRIGGVLQPGDSMKIENMRDEANNSAHGGSVQLANKQGCIMLFDSTQNIVDSVTYVRTRERAIMEGLPFVFHFGKPFAIADTVHSEKVYPAVGIMALSTKGAGWITLANLSGEVMDLSKGWTLDDGTTKIELTGTMRVGRTLKIERTAEIRKTEGNFTLRSPQGEVVDSVKYSRARSSRLPDGTPVVFHANI